MMTKPFLSAVLAVAMVSAAGADPWSEVEIEQYGSVELTVDTFPRTQKYASQDDVMAALTVTPQVVVFGDDYEIVIEPRLVTPRRGQQYADLKEGYFISDIGGIEVLAGTTTVFWGKNEAVNLVDIINTKDYTMGLQSGVKQGMPMVRLGAPVGPGDAEVYIMPHFVENRYGDARSRHRTPLPMKPDTSRFQTGTDKDEPSLALRYAGYIGDIDYGLSYFKGISRSPGMEMDGFNFVPLYHDITQTGVDLQWIYGDTAFKGEVIRRTKQLNSNTVAEDYTAGIIGVEHTFYGVMDSNGDLALFTEYARDSRDETAASGFQDDVFVGASLALNDVDDTQMRLISSYDLDYFSRTMTASLNRRLADALTLDASLYVPAGLVDDGQFSSFDRDTRVHVTLKWSW